MLYFEDYVIVNKGLKRDKNQDNIYVNGLYLRENNNGLNSYEKKNNWLKKELNYAIFDGIGGIDNGGYASYICSKILSLNFNKSNNIILNIINTKILEINKEKNINMGSTASIIKIKRNKLYISQVGDSPVYLLSKGQFTKLSEKNDNSNLLDNYLGKQKCVNVSNKIITLKKGDKILMCSDGLSNEVGELEIEYIMDQSDDTKYIADKLLNYALVNGGKDNISIITIIVKRNKFLLYIFLLVLILIVLFIIFS